MGIHEIIILTTKVVVYIMSKKKKLLNIFVFKTIFALYNTSLNGLYICIYMYTLYVYIYILYIYIYISFSKPLLY